MALIAQGLEYQARTQSISTAIGPLEASFKAECNVRDPFAGCTKGDQKFVGIHTRKRDIFGIRALRAWLLQSAARL